MSAYLKPKRPSANGVRDRKSHSVRFLNAEWQQVENAAKRTRWGDLNPRRWWSDHPGVPTLSWCQSITLDWAQHVNALPASVKAQKPSEVVKALQERNAQLEALLRAHGIDPNASPPVEHKGQATVHCIRRKVGGTR